MSFWKLVGALVVALLLVVALILGGTTYWFARHGEEYAKNVGKEMDAKLEAIGKEVEEQEAKRELENEKREKEYSESIRAKKEFLKNFSIQKTTNATPTDEYQERFLAEFVNNSPKTVTFIQFKVTYYNSKDEIIDYYNANMYVDAVGSGQKSTIQWWRSVRWKDRKDVAQPTARFDVELLDVKVID